MPDVLVFGSIGYDILTFIPFLPQPGKDAPVRREERHVGGEACNIALALATWDVSVSIGGNVIGDDEAGDYILEHLSIAGVDISRVERSREATTPYCRVLVLPDGERYILSYGHEGIRFSPPPVSWMRGAKLLVTDRFGGEPRDSLVHLARSRGITLVSLDAVSSGDARRAVSDVVVSSVSVARGVFSGVSVGSCFVAKILHEMSGKTAIITDGPRPVCTVSNSGDVIEMHPYPASNPVDTTGAGDSFSAGIVYGVLNGWPLERSIEFALAAATLTIQRIGADNPPSLEEVINLMIEERH